MVSTGLDANECGVTEAGAPSTRNGGVGVGAPVTGAAVAEAPVTGLPANDPSAPTDGSPETRIGGLWTPGSTDREAYSGLAAPLELVHDRLPTERHVDPTGRNVRERSIYLPRGKFLYRLFIWFGWIIWMGSAQYEGWKPGDSGTEIATRFRLPRSLPIETKG